MWIQFFRPNAIGRSWLGGFDSRFNFLQQLGSFLLPQAMTGFYTQSLLTRFRIHRE